MTESASSPPRGFTPLDEGKADGSATQSSCLSCLRLEGERDQLRDRLLEFVTQTRGYYTDPSSSWTNGQRQVGAIADDLLTEIEAALSPDPIRERTTEK